MRGWTTYAVFRRKRAVAFSVRSFARLHRGTRWKKLIPLAVLFRWNTSNVGRRITPPISQFIRERWQHAENTKTGLSFVPTTKFSYSKATTQPLNILIVIHARACFHILIRSSARRAEKLLARDWFDDSALGQRRA